LQLSREKNGFVYSKRLSAARALQKSAIGVTQQVAARHLTRIGFVFFPPSGAATSEHIKNPAVCVTSQAAAYDPTSRPHPNWVRFFKKAAASSEHIKKPAVCITSQAVAYDPTLPTSPQLGSFFQKGRRN
jgi:hypothetical protein